MMWQSLRPWVAVTGLALDFLGAALAAWSVYATADAALDVGVTRWASSSREQNLQLPLVQNFLRHSRWAVGGLVIVAVGFLLQLIAAWPSTPSVAPIAPGDDPLAPDGRPWLAWTDAELAAEAQTGLRGAGAHVESLRRHRDALVAQAVSTNRLTWVLIGIGGLTLVLMFWQLYLMVTAR